MVEADARFIDEEPEPGKRTEDKIKPRYVGIILFIISLLTPGFVQLSTAPRRGLHFTIFFIFFILDYIPYEGIHISPTFYVPWGFPDLFYFMNIMMIFAVFGGPRLVFSYQMVRFYKGRTTKRRALALGVVTDCYFLLYMLPALLSMLLYPLDYIFMILPIPLVLLTAILLIRLRTPSELITPWKELDEPDKW